MSDLEEGGEGREHPLQVTFNLTDRQTDRQTSLISVNTFITYSLNSKNKTTKQQNPLVAFADNKFNKACSS